MFHRREMLQIGCSSFFGLGLSGLMQRQAVAAVPPQRAKSVVLIFLTGGGSHIDMFDPKPDVAEIKGEFSPIATAIPGVQFTDKLPGLASRADKLTIVRSMAHADNRHLSGSHNALTGTIQPFRGDSNEDKSLNRGDWPSYGSALSYLRPRSDQLPNQVTLPNPLIEGVLVWPGQHSGFLGPRYDPFVIRDDPNSENYQVRDLTLADGLSMTRLNNRRNLLKNIDTQERGIDSSPQGSKYTTEQQRAFSMLTSSTLKSALDIRAESAETRDRYGRHKYGQTLLLARRLVEIEMPVIQCNMGHVQMWDTHVDHFPRLTTMLPALDAGFSALLDDLSQRGLLDQALIVCVGEFGRTPTISPLAGQSVPGRHHWASGYTAVFAGAGTLPGQVIGQTDRIGGQPITTPFHPNDIGATIYNYLGVNPHTMVHDRLGRPRPLNEGRVMDVLTTGEST
jgi:hypothetical protein